MKTKQTAVEWLVKMLYSPVCVGFIQGRRQIPHDIIEQAKQMEKEQIEEAYWTSYKEGQYSGEKTAEEYYNETYNK